MDVAPTPFYQIGPASVSSGVSSEHGLIVVEKQSITPAALFLTIRAWDNHSILNVLQDRYGNCCRSKNCYWSIIGGLSLRSGCFLHRCDPERRDAISSSINISVQHALGRRNSGEGGWRARSPPMDRRQLAKEISCLGPPPLTARQARRLVNLY